MTADKKVLEFKSTQLFTLRLVIKTTDFSGIVQNIHQHMKTAGKLFEGETIVIDAYGIVQPLPWSKLVDVLKQYQLHVLGIYTNERLLPTVINEGFLPIQLSQSHDSKTETISSNVSATQSVPTVSPQHVSNETMVINRHLRSGERIYAAGSDLIVIGNVGHGAEVIADGHVHVYGHLLGRAIAGAKGNSQAKIFTTYLDPQLVAVAGIYRLFDGESSPEGLKNAAVVNLHHESLTFTPLKG